MYGSNFCSCTSNPRETSSLPIDAAAIPFPSDDTTPPVMKMKRVWLSAMPHNGIVAAGRAPDLSGCPQQLASVLARGSVSVACAEHPHQLGDDTVARELGHRGPCGATGGPFFDLEMAIGERSDLRQVGDAQDLPPLRQRPEMLANGAGGVAADARVDLVEHEHRLEARLGARVPAAPAATSAPGADTVSHAQQREHHARELPSGGNLSQRARGHP